MQSRGGGCAAVSADKHLAKLRVDWHEDFRRYHPDQEWIWQVDGLGVFDMAINALSAISRLFAPPPFVQSAVIGILPPTTPRHSPP
jgi:hypothetical protein